ncbi:hypothetical protein ABMA28_010390 [Loxostege sticticalis]|uniref:Uncharacterized protein n=1 Tax=Loxostege sticticalis TaxID=481309 RepID=A0ABD0SAN9_LOXSC
MGADTLSLALGGVILFMCLFLFWMCFCFGNWVKRRQKTRNTQQRRMYTGSRTRQLSMQGEPTIFVSPANLPPPPKYEAMAPPSYEEVMAIQYPPGFQQGQQPQPITQPITHAMAQGSTSTDIPAVHTVTNNTSNGNARCTEVVTTAPAIVTVTNEERRTSVTVSARA